MPGNQGGPRPTPVDVIVPVYRENPDGLKATLSACLSQTYPVSQIYVVDDGSPVLVVIPEDIASRGKVRLIRLAENRGISAARNVALAFSRAPYVACVNSEVLPAREWLEICLPYLERHPKIGACFTRIVPQRPQHLLSRWRMRFQELKFSDASGPAEFAPGHAVLFRKQAIDCVGGYTERLRRINEDSDICARMWKTGWETHFIVQSQCVSIQQDTLASLSNKQLLRSDWSSPDDYSVVRVFLDQTRWMLVRAGRNIAKMRLVFLPVDVAIWAGALATAIVRARDHRRKKVRPLSSDPVASSRGNNPVPDVRRGPADDARQVAEKTPKT